MGERLVIQVKRNHSVVATAYYHWSAYTEPALHITKALCDCVLSKAKDMSDDELRLAMIRFAECSNFLGHFNSAEERDEAAIKWREVALSRNENVVEIMEDLLLSHGGVDLCDFDFATNKFPNESFELDNISRNEGLVGISPKTIENHLNAALCIIDVDLDKNEILNGVIDEYSISDYLETMEEEDDEDYVNVDQITRIPIDLAKFHIGEIELIQEVITLNRGYWMRYEDKIYKLIDG